MSRSSSTSSDVTDAGGHSTITADVGMMDWHGLFLRSSSSRALPRDKLLCIIDADRVATSHVTGKLPIDRGLHEVFTCTLSVTAVSGMSHHA